MLELKDQLERAQARMKNQAEKKIRDVEFIVGDFAYLKLRP